MLGGMTTPRVAEVHHQARRTLAVAGAFVLAGVAAAVAPEPSGTWLPLHLFLVGGLLSAISGATVLLAVTWSASPAPPRARAAVQRWLLAGGAVAVATGGEAGDRAVAVAGAAAVVVALGLLALHLVRIRATAVTDRFAPAIDGYVAAIVLGAVGVALGALLLTGRTGTRWFDVRAAHLTLNLYGLVGLVVAATLPWFVATQARTKMSARATPGAVRAVLVALALATVTSAGGHLAGRPGVAAGALVGYALGIVVLLGLLPRVGRRQLAWAGPRLLQLGAGIGWWVGATLALAAVTADGPSGQGPILRALAVGGLAQILVASLAYLGPVLRGGGHERLTQGFALTRSWPGLVLANVAAASLAASWWRPAQVALVAWALDTAVRGIRLAGSRSSDREGTTSRREGTT
jgi:nitrite reductase (NO-forming)